jgi:nucleotide-binding universal stress UspA family protein
LAAFIEVGAMTTMLVAIDDSSYSEKVVRVAARLAEALKSEVTIFHLAPHAADVRGTDVDLEGDRARETVEVAVKSFKAAGVGSAVGRVDRGLTGEEATAILDVARELDAEMIVMGHRGTGRLLGLLVGSVAHKVISVADRPVLIVR